ncbi:MAG TPA: ATP-grasp domain-containing protein [Burkholderiaceae bacterium]|nr:ATP-grasp domain-containing protein [Burkholderiaceae bacterium]
MTAEPTTTTTTTPPTIVLAGLSVRAAAQAAQREGFQVLALDAFGDRDTRDACAQWGELALEADQPWQIDLTGLDAALRALDAPPGTPLMLTSGLAAEGADAGRWITRWELDLGLRLAGQRPHNAEPLRDPRRFFATLDALGIAHPPVTFTPPADPAGWLRKDFGAAGGGHIQRVRPDEADVAAPGPRVYWQREVAGAPLSLTLLADGQRAALLGINRQRLAPTADAPWRFGGVIGPLPLPPELAERLQPRLDALAAHFHLQGLASVDLIAPAAAPDDPSRALLLEINPRWSASAALYGGDAGTGLIQAHLDACAGRLPDAASLAALRPPPGRLRGVAPLYTDAPLDLDERRWAVLVDAARSAGGTRLHDLPATPRHFGAGEPVCSISAVGGNAAAVEQALQLDLIGWLAFLHGAASEPPPPL